MAQIIDFVAKKKERDIKALTEAFETEKINYAEFLNAYMNAVYSNDDGLNAQINFEMMFDE